MADAAQIEQAIANALSAAVYPNGTTGASALAFPVKFVRGWPTEASLADAKKAGGGLVAAHQKVGFARTATRYARNWQTLSQAAPTVTATLSGFALTIGGAITAGNIIAVQSLGVGYTYVVLATDTASTIAAALAARVAGATASGAVVTLPSGAFPAAIVVAGGIGAVEVARQQAAFSISCFSPSPADRDAMISLLFPAACMIDPLMLPDGTMARQLTQQVSGPDDMPMRVGLWRREIMLVFDYPVIFTAQQAAAAAAVAVNLTPANTNTTTIYAV